MRNIHPLNVVVLSALLGALVFGCSAQKSEPSFAHESKTQNAASVAPGAPEVDESEEEPSDVAQDEQNDDDMPTPAGQVVKRHIIYTANMGIFVESVPNAHKSIEALAKEHNAWLQTSENTRLRIRVPADRFDVLVTQVEALGDVQYLNKTGRDVTEEFVDTEARLANAEVMRKRYVHLLSRAKTVEESLAIERELGRITEVIERHKGRLKYLRNQIAFSTIDVNLQPKPNELPTPERIALPFRWLQNYSIENMVAS